MKLEKRSSGSDVTPDLPEEKGKHPVVVYIVVLFLAAFLLMAMSLVMQHRSNQAMGRLEDSVSALQETQRVQDENLQLQKEIQDLTEELAQAQSDLAESESQLAEQGQALQALNLLYELQQEFSARDYEACEKTIAALESDGLKDTLSQEVREGLTSPAPRYQQLKAAGEPRCKPPSPGPGQARAPAALRRLSGMFHVKHSPSPAEI